MTGLHGCEYSAAQFKMQNSTEVPDALATLASYRLTNDLSFDALADRMCAAGFTMKGRSLHLLLTGQVAVPHERTLHKISGFLATISKRKAS